MELDRGVGNSESVGRKEWKWDEKEMEMEMAVRVGGRAGNRRG